MRGHRASVPSPHGNQVHGPPNTLLCTSTMKLHWLSLSARVLIGVTLCRHFWSYYWLCDWIPGSLPSLDPFPRDQAGQKFQPSCLSGLLCIIRPRTVSPPLPGYKRMPATILQAFRTEAAFSTACKENGHVAIVLHISITSWRKSFCIWFYYKWKAARKAIYIERKGDIFLLLRQ